MGGSIDENGICGGSCHDRRLHNRGSGGANPNVETVVPELHTTACALGLELVVGYANSESDVDVAFESFVRGRVQALLVDADPVFFSRLQHLNAAAARRSIPAMDVTRQYVEGGGLM